MKSLRNSPVVVVGEFDGGHVGHRHLIETGISIAEEVEQPLVVVVMDDPVGPPRIDSVGSRCLWALSCGACTAVAISANGGLSAGTSIAQRTVADLQPSLVVLACAASDRSALTRPPLRPAFEELGVQVVEVPRALDIDGEPVTSSRVREALERGALDSVHRLLGRRYSIVGEVVRGNQRGRTIGFPTANVIPSRQGVLPPFGVYAGRVAVDDGHEYTAAVNLGVRPTVVSGGQVLLEAHLLGFDGDLYGREINVAFYGRLRSERRFDSLDDLTSQLSEDVAAVRSRMRSLGF
jgi:riboflavin kinase / FMN adenylyltransferase